jgi:hypothetical protein
MCTREAPAPPGVSVLFFHGGFRKLEFILVACSSITRLVVRECQGCSSFFSSITHFSSGGRRQT